MFKTGSTFGGVKDSPRLNSQVSGERGKGPQCIEWFLACVLIQRGSSQSQNNVLVWR